MGLGIETEFRNFLFWTATSFLEDCFRVGEEFELELELEVLGDEDSVILLAGRRKA